jgi:hypothetical protein
VTSAPLWAAVIALGAFHGANPSMGWLFAVSNGMAERRTRAVFLALPPIALGHLLAMAVVLLPIAVVTALAVHFTVVRFAAGAIVIAFGIYRLIVRRHPRALARIGSAHLTLWSFVMATAHGAALMLVPVYFGMVAAGAGPMNIGSHAAMMTSIGGVGSGLAAASAVAIVHTAAMLVIAGIIAWIVYRYLGLALLTRIWFNVDLFWAAALILAGVFAMIV